MVCEQDIHPWQHWPVHTWLLYKVQQDTNPSFTFWRFKCIDLHRIFIHNWSWIIMKERFHSDGQYGLRSPEMTNCLALEEYFIWLVNKLIVKAGFYLCVWAQHNPVNGKKLTCNAFHALPLNIFTIITTCNLQVLIHKQWFHSFWILSIGVKYISSFQTSF